jgi:hypothetical protein
MNSLPVESFTTLNSSHGNFIATLQPSNGATASAPQMMFQNPCWTGTPFWQVTTPVQQNVQQMVLVPVCFVTPACINPPVENDASGFIMHSNMGSLQGPEMYQVTGQSVPGSMTPGNYVFSSMQSTMPNFNMMETMLCQQAEMMPVMQEQVQAETNINAAVPNLDSMKLISEQAETHHEIAESHDGCRYELEDEADSIDDLSVSITFDDKYDSRSFASSEASTAVSSRTARRRRGRRAAKAKAKEEGLSAFPILESPPLEEVSVTPEMSKMFTRQLKAGGDEMRTALSKINGSVLSMAFEPSGCRVVQLALDVANASERQAIAAELRGHVHDAVSSPHANFVIQKMIEVLPVSSSNFVAEELLTFAVDAARHRFACRILSRLIEHHLCDKAGLATMNRLIDELLPETERLIRHNFARHVVELILEHGSKCHQETIIRAIRKDAVRNAKDRYASYVVEHCLYHCSVPERDALASDLLCNLETFWVLANHECASHVIKALLKSHGSFATRAMEQMNVGAAKLCTSKYGQRLLEEMG